MDLHNARILIRKLNSLFKSIDDAEADISQIERDLMLSYLRQLYALFLDDKAPQAHSPAESAPPKAEPLHVPPPVVEKKPEPVPFDSIPKVVFPEPTPAPIPEQKPSPAPIPAPEPFVPAPPPSAPREVLAKPASHTSNAAVDKLFSFKKASDLSERLSESPIQDLNKSMSINDRLLYINELFGRDRSALEDSLTLLNRFDAFDAAQSFLRSLAEQYHWGQEARFEIAQTFIKLVRRRFPQ
ncbi:MAG: hypothetical protein IPN74_13840 [Haliscomenobacter sp.]|nr:hypothetical protein [Haliscomenobacter sp.]